MFIRFSNVTDLSQTDSDLWLELLNFGHKTNQINSLSKTPSLSCCITWHAVPCCSVEVNSSISQRLPALFYRPNSSLMPIFCLFVHACHKHKSPSDAAVVKTFNINILTIAQHLCRGPNKTRTLQCRK